MTKFIEEVDGTSGISRTEHALRSVLEGDAESARKRLTRALERLGYHVISEDPLYARRSARGWAVYYCSFNILDYQRKLRISFKPLGPNATLATFDYEVEHFGAFSSKGDRQTLRLEAEALIALAIQDTITTLCRRCGTNQPDDSRFCRVCGAPNVSGVPAELELLRVTSGARGTQHLINAAVVWALAPLLTGLVGLMFFGAGGVRFAAGLLLAQAANLIILFFVLNSSRKTLNPDRSQQQMSPGDLSQADVTSELTTPAANLKSLPEREYVTEGTTELLTVPRKDRERELVDRG